MSLIDHESGIGKEALVSVSLRIRAGEAVALIGPSGSGKTTLLSVAAGVVRPSTGVVTVAGRDVTRGKRSWDRWLRATVGVAFQFPERGFFAATVREEVALTPSQLGWSEGAIHEAVGRSLALVGLDRSFENRSPFRLSGGEKRRVALAAAVAHRPRLVLLDEPEVGMDLDGRQRVEELIHSLTSEGVAVVVATHDVGAAIRWADRCVLLNKGRVSEVVETASGLSDEGLQSLMPYLWDQGVLARVHREASKRGLEAPDPYRETDAFLAALTRSLGKAQ